jgi:hypothetical protein
MTTTVHLTTTKPVRMDPSRKTALAAGGFYLLSFISIPTLALYGPVHDPDYIVGSGPGTGVLWGSFLEVIVAVACIGTAVTLFPVLKRQNEAVALGFVAARVLEAAIIFVGVATLLTVVTLRQPGAGADATSLITTGTSLVAIHDWTVLLGQTLMPGINALLLGSLLYRSRLVPRTIPALGLIGGPLLLASTIAVLFGLHELGSVWSVIATAPVFVWELSLGIWLVVKGFKPLPITSANVPAHARPVE